MTTELLVGSCVYNRTWAMPDWFAHIETSAAFAGFDDLAYVFVGDKRDPTMDLIRELGKQVGRTVYCVWVDEEDPTRPYVRTWTEERYHRMVFLRNTLLGAVRELTPKLFWSVDTDILVGQDSLELMGQAVTYYGYDAVGGRSFMQPYGTRASSYAYFTAADTLSRDQDIRTLETVECIMAVKLMTPQAYNIDYRYHWQGEDCGWSRACLEAGLKLGYDGRTNNKHCMVPEALTVVDERVGF